MLHSCHSKLISDFKQTLGDIGILVESVQPHEAKKDDFVMTFGKHVDPIALSDSYHMTKMLLKMRSLEFNYDISFAPAEDGSCNHVSLKLTPSNPELIVNMECVTQNQGLLTPNINSWRKVKGK